MGDLPNMDRHPNSEISNDPPSTILTTYGNLRLWREPKLFDVTRHLFGFFQDLLEGEVLHVGIASPHWLSHKPLISKLGNILHKMIEERLIFRHDGIKCGLFSFFLVVDTD